MADGMAKASKSVTDVIVVYLKAKTVKYLAYTSNRAMGKYDKGCPCRGNTPKNRYAAVEGVLRLSSK